MTIKIIDKTYSSISEQKDQNQFDVDMDRKQSSIIAAKQIRQRYDPKNLNKQYSGDDHDGLVLKFPAIILAGLLNLMLAIPFGVSYFPIEWGSAEHGMYIACLFN